jgi:DNA invertase Pin-like site-specific DNA recombinase
MPSDSRNSVQTLATASIWPVRFVAKYRVSTELQGRSSLGLDAQHEAVTRHVAAAGGEVVADFQEVESGKRNDRPQLAAALAACRARRC